MGKSPAKVYATKPAGEGAIDENTLRAALTVRSRRRVSSDNVLSLDGIAWELDPGYLARQIVTAGWATRLLRPDLHWHMRRTARRSRQPLDIMQRLASRSAVAVSLP